MGMNSEPAERDSSLGASHFTQNDMGCGLGGLTVYRLGMRRQRTFFVYMLMNQKGTLYTGVTNNLEFRLAQHRSGTGNKFTAQYDVHRLVWYDTTTDVNAAITSEKQIKGWLRSKKIALIKENNPNFRDLAQDWGLDQAEEPVGRGSSALRASE